MKGKMARYDVFIFGLLCLGHRGFRAPDFSHFIGNFFFRYFHNISFFFSQLIWQNWGITFPEIPSYSKPILLLFYPHQQAIFPTLPLHFPQLYQPYYIHLFFLLKKKNNNNNRLIG